MFLKSLAGSPRVKKMINTEVSSMNEIQVISTAWSISTCECNNDTIKLQWRCNSIDVDDGESTSTSSASPLLMLHHVTVKLHYSVAKPTSRSHDGHMFHLARWNCYKNHISYLNFLKSLNDWDTHFHVITKLSFGYF